VLAEELEDSMARPRKDQEQPDAKQRILDAFWELLEDNALQSITVAAISKKAHCNRGTFYYHFNDMDDLLNCAIESTLFEKKGVPYYIFGLVSGTNEDIARAILAEGRMNRFALIVKKCGGTDIVEKKAKKIMVDMWQTVLCPGSGELPSETRCILEYAIGGMFGLVSYRIMEDPDVESLDAVSKFIAEAAKFTLNQVAHSIGAPIEEVLARLQMFNQMIRFNDN
jgi:AcrR family transcriptional regulator